MKTILLLFPLGISFQVEGEEHTSTKTNKKSNDKSGSIDIQVKNNNNKLTLAEMIGSRERMLSKDAGNTSCLKHFGKRL